MSDQGILIFRARFNPLHWLVLLLGPFMGLMLLLDGQSATAAFWVGAITVAVTFTGIVGLSRWDGRLRLGEVRLDGDRLRVRGYRAFGLGPEKLISLDQTDGWDVYEWSGRSLERSGVRFRFEGSYYRMPLSAAQFADIDAINRLRFGLR